MDGTKNTIKKGVDYASGKTAKREMRGKKIDCLEDELDTFRLSSNPDWYGRYVIEAYKGQKKLLQLVEDARVEEWDKTTGKPSSYKYDWDVSMKDEVNKLVKDGFWNVRKRIEESYKFFGQATWAYKDDKAEE